MPYRLTLDNINEYIPEIQRGFNRLKYVTQDIHKEVMGDDPPFEELIFDNNTLNQLYSMVYDYEEQKELFKAIFLHKKPLPFENPYKLPNRYNIFNKMPITIRQSENITFVNGSVLTAEEVQAKYTAKVKNRCELQLKMGQKNCIKVFRNAYKNCQNKLPPVLKGLMCWPYKLSFICNLSTLGQLINMCDPKDVIPDSLGRAYIELLKDEEKIFEVPENTKFNYSLADIQNLQEV